MNTTSAATPAVAALPKELEASHKSLSNATKESAASQIHWNKVANEGHAAARGLAGSLGTLWITYGSLIPLLAGATIGSAFINAAKAGSEFAYQLTFVKALGGESAEAVQKLSDAALSLSQTGLRGPTEIASGFRILAQAGLDASEALEAMPQTLNLATVGEMEMEQAAVTLVGVMKAFNLTVKDSERVGDVFAKAAALSQTSVQGMTEAMKTASVVGEQYGANLEDTATAITLLAKVNITGTAAGTSFRNMLKELYAPVPQSAKAMENLGLKTKDAEGNLRNFADVIYDLKGRLSDFSKGDQVEILQRLFGERGAKEAVAMLALTKDKWVELRDEIKNSKGFMEGVATELENTAKGKWAQAINTMKVQLVTAFNEMEPIFSQLADNLKALFADPAFLQNLKAIVGGMASLTNAVIEMAPHLITLAQAWVVYKAGMITAAVWTATSTAVMGFATSMQIASGIMGPALGPMASMKAIVAGLPSLLMAIPTPLTIIAGGLAAGAVAWTIWGNNASRAGDKAYDAAVRASAALDKVSRREKYGVGDLGEAQEELDKAEKLLSLRVEGRATGTALSDARESVAKWGKVVEGLEREKYKASNASEGLKAAVAGETKKPTRKASEILGSEGRGAGGSGRGALKDARSILNDNLESGLKQEKIQLGRELIEIEIDLAAQTISTTVATEKKNQATMASLEIERLLIEASLADAKAAGDKVQVEKFLNDLAENSLKLEKQQQQALLDTTKARTANRNAIDDLSVSTGRYIDDLQFEQIALDKTAQEVAQLRIEREQLRAVEDLQRRVDRNQVDPEVAKAERGAIDAKAAAQMQDQEFQRSYVAGWKKAHKAYVDDATNAAKQAADSYQAMSSAIEGALDEFLTTGKLNFAKFAQSVILDIAKIEAKALAAKAMSSIGGGEGGFGGIVNGILGMFGGGGGGFSSGDFANLAASFIDSAKGNVFSGSPSLHAYANTVQTSPKTFAFQNLHGFAKGGIFAEAGPEAVMPLKRDSYGRLGVQAEGGDGKVINITVNINGNNNNPQDVRRAAGQGAREALALLNSARRYA
jgi:TP901 family phage tail tape measure protein/lambda family phage tail tape measure protein